MNRFIFLLMALAVLVSRPMRAQDLVENTERHVRLVLNDGSIKEGVFVSMDDEVVVLVLPDLGQTRFPKHLIQAFTDIEPTQQRAHDGTSRAFDINPQSSRYFFAPSGMQLRANEGYFQSNIGLNSVSYGLTDGFTLGGIVSFLGGGGTIKVGTPIGEKAYVSVGGIGFSDFYGILDRPLGLAFANVTFGDEVANFTVNVGFGSKTDQGQVYRDIAIDTMYVGFDFVEYQLLPAEVAPVEGRPFIVNMSAMTPMAPSRWIITENYFIRSTQQVGSYSNYTGGSFYYSGNQPLSEGLPTEDNLSENADQWGIISLGIRSLNRRTGWLWDYGLVGVFNNSGDGFAAPWFSFTLAF